MYDNLLANVPTGLWIGGKWRKASDNARFDVIDPASEQLETIEIRPKKSDIEVQRVVLAWVPDEA